MKWTIALTLALLAAPALADTLAVEAAPARYAGRAVMDYATGEMTWSGVATRNIDVYRNTTTVTAAFSQNPGAYIGDDLLMTGGGILTSIEFSVFAGASNTRNLDQSDFTIDFYNDDDGAYVATLDLGTVTWGGIQPGYYGVYTITNLETLAITLPQNIDVVQRHRNVLGGPRVGQVLANPPTIGASMDYFYIDNTTATPAGTSKGWSWFSGNPVANFYWAVGIVPEPASLALLALGGLLLRRR